MSKPTIRRKGKITIKFQMTEFAAQVFTRMIEDLVSAANGKRYPNEMVNPSKGDFIEAVVKYKE